MNLLEAMQDKRYFAPWFEPRETWTAWRAFLAALFALPMDADLRTPPFVDPLSEGSYIYRLVEDDEFGRPYLLYSVGADGEDDHAGERFVDPTKPVAWIGIGQERLDLLITTVREPRREDEY